jgi:hypothetical protein
LTAVVTWTFPEVLSSIESNAEPPILEQSIPCGQNRMKRDAYSSRDITKYPAHPPLVVAFIPIDRPVRRLLKPSTSNVLILQSRSCNFKVIDFENVKSKINL